MKSVLTFAARHHQPLDRLCGLPGINGYDLLQCLQGLPALARTIFVAIIGYGQAEDRERIRRAGVHAHPVKPVNLPDQLRLVAPKRPTFI